MVPNTLFIELEQILYVLFYFPLQKKTWRDQDTNSWSKA